MESVDSSQPLDLFVQSSVITCGVSTTGQEAIALLQNGWSYVVVLDRRGHPQGLFTPQCVLSWLNLDGSQHSCHLEQAHRTLNDLDLQPLPTITSNTTVIEFLARISQYQYSASIWALVDRDNKYLGIIEVLPLIRQLVWQNINVGSQSLTQLTYLIEQLPLPLMVCNLRGEALVTNHAWRNSIGRAELNAESMIAHTGLTKRYQFSDLTGEVQTWQVVSAALSGNFQGLEIAIAQDITAQEQLAAELSGQNANLVHLNRLKDEFLACVSHELKTPLTSVIGIAGLLNTKTLGELNERQSRYVHMIHQSGRHLTDIIDNIVDLAKAETGQLELYIEYAEIAEVCQYSINQALKLTQQDSSIYQTNLTEPQPPSLKIQLHIDDQLSSIVADQARLQQMLVNLLSNAIKFTETAQQPQVGINVHQWEGWIAFTVWDKGIGIPEDKQHLIFQKFQQLENTLTRRFEGTGLGLALTRHLARLHGGDVTFVSQPGSGSEFTILLPPVPPQHVEIENLQMSVTPGRLVLIVETVSRDITMLMNTLTAWGYRVVIARLGTEALEKARRLQPCLIVLSPDLSMLSGWDVLSLLKQDSATRHIRVVMAVELSDRISDNEQVAHQADGFLIKPIQAADLNIFLPHHLTKKSPLRLLCLGNSLEENLTSALQSLGHRSIEVTDIDQGETLAQIWHPDLLLLNVEEDKLSVALKQISETGILGKLPILVMAEVPSLLRQQFSDLGLHDYVGHLNEPIVIAELHRTLKKAVGHLRSPTVLILNFTGAEALTQSLQQYLSLAGFHVHTLQNPELLATQMQNFGVDAVLLAIHDEDEQPQLSAEIQSTLQCLSQIAAHPPLIVIDNRSGNSTNISGNISGDTMPKLLALANVVLKQPDAITNLLPALYQSLSIHPLP